MLAIRNFDLDLEIRPPAILDRDRQGSAFIHRTTAEKYLLPRMM